MHRKCTRSANEHMCTWSRIFLLMSVGRAFVLHSVELHQSWGTECFLTCDYICLCSGARETDYPAGEEVAPNSETGPAGDGSSQPTSSSSTGCDAVLGGITVVGCEVEGAAAVPQTATSPGKDGETGQRCNSIISLDLIVFDFWWWGPVFMTYWLISHSHWAISGLSFW